MSFIFLLLMFGALVMMVRNTAVFTERMKMNELIFRQDNWYDLLPLKDSVEYNDMMLRFWVWPVYSMWPEELRKLRGND
jgi:hypothetical protein